MGQVVIIAQKDTSLAQQVSSGTNMAAGEGKEAVVGYDVGSTCRPDYGRYRGQWAVKMTMPDWSGLNIGRIDSAYIRVQSTIGWTCNYSVYVQRISASWGTPDSYTKYNASGSPKVGDLAAGDSLTRTGSVASLSTTDIDVTNHVEDMAPTWVRRNNNSGWGADLDNHGWRVSSTNADDSGNMLYLGTCEAPLLSKLPGFPSGTIAKPRLVINYTETSTPSCGINNIGTTYDTTPTISGTFSDTNPAQTLTAFRVMLGSTAGASDLYDSGKTASGISGNTWSKTSSTLTAPDTVYVTAYTWNDLDIQSAAASTSFTLAALPTASVSSPASGNLAYIWNLGTDTQVWTGAGSYAKPRVKWTYDGGGSAQGAYQVRIYNDASKTTTLYDSTKTAGSVTQHDCAWAGVAGTAYYVTIQVWNSSDVAGVESTPQAFKMRWGQVIYEYAVTGGTASGSWSFSADEPVSNTQHGFLFAAATGASGSGRGTWKTSIGAVTPNAYLNVLVRLASNASGTQPVLGAMLFEYVSTAATPDHWEFAGLVDTDWTLDSDTRRYGTKSLKYECTSTSVGQSYAQPFRHVASDGVPVVPGVTYTFSAWVKTVGTLAHGDAYLEINDGTASPAQSASVNDTSAHPDGWERISITWTNDESSGVYTVWPRLVYDHTDTTAGDAVWWDAAKLEEGAVATAWAPGFVGRAVVIDAGGINIDGEAGGTFRLRASDGTVTELGTSGLEQNGAPLGVQGAWPVGSIFIETTGTNPATSLGFGTWTAFGTGRVLVGYDSGDTDFDTAEETGGSKTHDHTYSTVIQHSHTTNVGTGSHNHVEQAHSATGATIRVSQDSTHTGFQNTNNSTAVSGADGITVSTNNSGSTSGTTATDSSVQPYIVVYMWKRTA